MGSSWQSSLAQHFPTSGSTTTGAVFLLAKDEGKAAI